MKTFGESKKEVYVFVLLSAVFAIALLFPYIRFYKLEHMNLVNKTVTIWGALKSHAGTSVIFGLLTASWILLTLIANAKISTTNKIFGPYFGGGMGRLLIFFEYLGFVAIIIVLFVQF